MRKLLICIPRSTFLAFRYMFYLFLSGYYSRTMQYIKFKFSSFLIVEVTKCVEFQSARCTDFKVGIFRISPMRHLFLLTEVNENTDIYGYW